VYIVQQKISYFLYKLFQITRANTKPPEWPSATPQQLKSSGLGSLPMNSLTPALPGIHFCSKASDLWINWKKK